MAMPAMASESHLSLLTLQEEGKGQKLELLAEDVVFFPHAAPPRFSLGLRRDLASVLQAAFATTEHRVLQAAVAIALPGLVFGCSARHSCLAVVPSKASVKMWNCRVWGKDRRAARIMGCLRLYGVVISTL
eukprot:6304894-Amphidinium_carterae.1